MQVYIASVNKKYLVVTKGIIYGFTC